MHIFSLCSYKLDVVIDYSHTHNALGSHSEQHEALGSYSQQGNAVSTSNNV